MKRRYQIIKTERMEDKVRLSLRPDDFVKEKQPGILEMATNLNGVINMMKQDAVLSQMPDLITIPYEEWKKHEYKIDDHVFVDLMPGEDYVKKDNHR